MLTEKNDFQAAIKGLQDLSQKCGRKCIQAAAALLLPNCGKTLTQSFDGSRKRKTPIPNDTQAYLSRIQQYGQCVMQSFEGSLATQYFG
jgi:hypothetical protein